jgi:transcriptional regulator GlxA family with amidase domain
MNLSGTVDLSCKFHTGARGAAAILLGSICAGVAMLSLYGLVEDQNCPCDW